MPERDAVEGVLGDVAGTPVTWVRSLSMLRSSAPPPDMTMPLSMMSELSSGGVCSRTVRTAATSCWSGASIASMTSDAVIGIVRGRPAIRSRPRTSIWQLALERQGGPDLDLDLLGGPLADHQVVLLADVRRDRLVELVAADAQAVETTMPPSAMTAISLTSRRRCR